MTQTNHSGSFPAHTWHPGLTATPEATLTQQASQEVPEMTSRAPSAPTERSDQTLSAVPVAGAIIGARAVALMSNRQDLWIKIF